ncbi:MAG: amino acid racemase [Burkholderiales bacterium]|jgi:aspartate racemase|nr:amino acid racemase [Burkholderiales bacterium]
MNYLVGVLGGMGPAATADFMSKIIELTEVGGDQQHIPLLISSMPDIPDRSAHLLNGGSSPQSALVHRLQMLEKAGAACIAMPCNTAHYWFSQLKAAASVDMLSIIDVTVEAAHEAGFSRVGLLATDATLQAGLYQTVLAKVGIECVAPEGAAQKAAMAGTYALKAGDPVKARDCLEVPYQYLQLHKVEAVILGCTEIPLILAKEIRKSPTYFLDSTKILAQAVIRWYESKTGSRLLRETFAENGKPCFDKGNALS